MNLNTACGNQNTGADESNKGKVYVPYPGADEKYTDTSDWRLYNPEKYRDPNWSPEKE